MSERIRSHPSGLFDGERQRAAAANSRGLMLRPTLLRCDEIASALDPPLTRGPQRPRLG
ncbi:MULTISPECIES: hypothetical protein [Brevibacterium]|uniref:hypothetical protein n=1 Tax=Brevibacterium TaxID=1696 RepID=UPI00142E6D10|nr:MULTISPECIES: hypothetical protein [Brevibacterium]